MRMEHGRGESHKVEHKSACMECGTEYTGDEALEGGWTCPSCEAKPAPPGDASPQSSHVVKRGEFLTPE